MSCAPYRTALLAMLAPPLLAACSAAPPDDRPRETVAAALAGWRSIGVSVEGRPIRARTHGAGPRRVYLIAGIHGDERPGLENVDRLAVLLDTALSPGVTVRLLMDVNPDGSAAGTRTNSRGVDLNRNWPAANFTPARDRGPAPLSEPEAAAVHADLVRFDPALVVVLHASRRGPFVNFDGPAREWARLFARGAARVDPRWRVVADMGYATPGSLGSFVGVDGQVPILTIELRRGESGEEAWPGLRAGMAEVLGSQAVFEVQ